MRHVVDGTQSQNLLNMRDKGRGVARGDVTNFAFTDRLARYGDRGDGYGSRRMSGDHDSVRCARSRIDSTVAP